MKWCVTLCLLLAACSDAALQLSSGGAGAFEPDIAVTDDMVAVVWNDNRHGNDDIYLRFLSPTLAPLSKELRLTATALPDYEASAAWFGDDIAVAWYERQRDGHLRVWLGLWDRSGNQRWLHPLTATDVTARIPVLQASGERLFIAWVEDAANGEAASRVRGSWVDAQGKATPAFFIASASRTTWNLNADRWADGRIAVVFDAVNRNQANELWLAVIDDVVPHVVQLSQDDGFNSKYPDIAVRDDLAALTWFDTKDGNEEVYLAFFQTVALAGPALDAQAWRITHTSGESIGAYLAWNGDVLGLAWNDDSAGRHDIFFQRFGSNGQALAPARQLSSTSPDSMIPSIEALGDHFVLAWNEVMLADDGHGDGPGAKRSEVLVLQAAGH